MLTMKNLCLLKAWFITELQPPHQQPIEVHDSIYASPNSHITVCDMKGRDWAVGIGFYFDSFLVTLPA